ncbi:MAG: uracil-DNA glycosylase [Clostridiales bacterium]|nr:uracil-DNA glycosylase [Clostridiales bacterium]
MKEALRKLYDEMKETAARRFPGAGEHLVLGDGPDDAPKVLLIGEAPGAHEVEQGRPFVGQAGKNLNEFLTLVGLERSDLFISNVVKLRPCKAGPTGRLSNRAPSREELEAFIPYLLKEIEIIDPAVIVTLGNTPLHALCGKDRNIGDCHGTLLEGPGGKRVYCLYHPAAIIYRRELKSVYEQDVLALGRLLRESTDI